MGYLGGGGSLGGVTSGAPELTLSITASSSQGALLSVSESASAAGGVGGFTYAWTLTDPTGTSRTALLSSSTAAAPTWSPDALPGAWTVACTVTSGAQTAKAVRTVTLGSSGWLEICDLDFALEDDQSPSGAALSVLNRAQPSSPAESLALANEAKDAASGPKIEGGRAKISPIASTSEIAPSATTQTAPGFSLALSSILTGYAAALSRGSRVLVVMQLDATSWVNTNDAWAISLEATLGLGVSGGSGLALGEFKQAGGVRGRVLAISDGTRTANTLTGIDAAGTRTFAVLFGAGLGAVAGWSTTAADADTLAASLALVAPGSSSIHGSSPYTTAALSAVEYQKPAEWRVGVYCGTTGASPGGVLAVERLRIYVGGVP